MYEYNGELCSIKTIPEKTGVAYGVLIYRLNHNWPLEKAIHTPIRKQKHPVHHTCILDGKIVDVEKVAKRFNLNSQSVRRRINRGETLLDVVNNPVRRPGGKAKIHIDIRGKFISCVNYLRSIIFPKSWQIIGTYWDRTGASSFSRTAGATTSRI